MKIDDFKELENKTKAEARSIEKLKGETILKFQELLNVCEKLQKKLEEKNKLAKEKLKNEIMDYFNKDSDLKIEEGDNFVSISFKNSQILASISENEDGYLSCNIHVNPGGIHNTMEIEPNDNDKSLLVWKNTTKLNDDFLDRENYKNLIEKCNNTTKLAELNSKLKRNIKKYQYAEVIVDGIKYLYRAHTGTGILNGFKDFFENHV